MIFYPDTSLIMCSHTLRVGSAHLLSINSAARFWLPASLYLLRPCSRARLSCLMYMDVLYADFAGAKIGENKISIRALF